MTGVEGNLVELPCNTSSTKEGDDVKLVLWFKNGSNKPIYTYDNRDASHSHWSDDTILRGRGMFINKPPTARLLIKDVHYGDQSVYKCRVDFKMAPTSISSITLQVVGRALVCFLLLRFVNMMTVSFFPAVPPETPSVFVAKKEASLQADEESSLLLTSEAGSKHEMSLGNVNKNTRPTGKYLPNKLDASS